MEYDLNRTIRTAKNSRLMAKLIDLFIVLVLSSIFYPVTMLFGLVYAAFADSIQNGQSVGKKIIGLRVISVEDGSPCTPKQSFIRNLPILIPLFFSIIPIWGWMFSFLLAVPLIGLEVYLIYNLHSGHRLGDVMAETTVMANDQNNIVADKRKKAGWFNKHPLGT